MHHPRDLGDAGEQVFNADGRTLAPASVGSQVAIMSVFSVVTVLAFNVLRPKNKIIYEPKVKYHQGNKIPPKMSDSMFGWLPPLIRVKEPELMDKIGLDAVAFLRFNRLLRWLFTGISVLTCGILIPINVVYNLQHVNAKKRDVLSMLTIRDVGGNFLFAHVAVTYLITILICVLVWIHWKQMVALRRQWFRSPEYLESFYARTLAITHIPKKLQSDAGIREIYESVKVPYPATSVHINRKVGKLPELIEFHNNTVRELETHLVKYLKGGKLGKKRPVIKIGATMGMGGKKVDAIDHFTEKLKRTEAAIEDYRNQIDSRKAENFGFASMAAVPYAHVVAKTLEKKHPKGADITLAPNPKDIIWNNMHLTDGEVARKKIHGFLWLAVVCFFNTVPLLIISVLANLNTLTTYVDFLGEWKDVSDGTFTVVSGVLPPIVSGLFGFFLPVIMRWLTRYMGALTQSRLDRAVVARYFAFLIISQLVIFTLIGVIFNCVKEIVIAIGKKTSFKEIIDNLHTLPDTINRTYIEQSSYWLTYFPLRGFMVVFDLAQVINLVWIFIKTRLFGRTPRDIREWTQPPDFEYAINYSNLLFMAAVGMVFAPLAPLVSLAAMVVLWMSSWANKYQLMFVFVSKVESGGRMWNMAINRLLVCVALMQALMVLTIGLQYGWLNFYWISTIPPIFIVIIFKIFLDRAFNNQFRYFSPASNELNDVRVHSERADNKGNRLEKRFGHPSLHAELFTPMLHANMMPLLSQVYNGKIGSSKAKLDEYGGQKMDAHVVEGIKIAAISAHELEYDPALYQRDRGELDWDARSMASTAYLGDMGGPPRMQRSDTYFTDNGSVATLPGYEKYMNNGAGTPGENFELARMDSPSEPLLAKGGYFHHQAMASQSSLAEVSPSMGREGHREAPLHRPQFSGDVLGVDRSHSPSSYVSPQTSSPQSQFAPPYARPGPPSRQASYDHPPPMTRSPGPQHSQYPPQPQRQESNYSYTQPQRPQNFDPYASPAHSQHGSDNGRGRGGNMAGRGAHRT